MKRISLNVLLCYYPKKEVYGLAYKFGRRLSDFLGERIFSLLLDSRILIFNNPLKGGVRFSDESYKLHLAAKGLEGFLQKVIEGKKLSKTKKYSIGDIFGKNDELVRKKIKNKKLVARTKSAWDFCRNDIQHYSSNPFEFNNIFKTYEETIDIIKLLFEDFYGKTGQDKEIEKGFKKYCLSRGFKKLLIEEPRRRYAGRKRMGTTKGREDNIIKNIMAKINVKKVIDGDTFQGTRGGFFRLADVNTPEKRKRGYQKAKENLKKLIEDEKLIVKIEGTSYGRKVVTTRIPGEKTTINEKMRRKGYK